VTIIAAEAESGPARENPTGSRRRAALFDMDKTLIAKNTAELYVRFQRDIGEATWRDSARVTAWLFQYSLGLLDAKGVATRLIGSYRGQSEAELIAKCERWYPDYVLPHLSKAGSRVVEARKAAGDFTAIVTASTRYASAPLARQLGIEDIVATEIEVDAKGLLTGGIVWPLCYAEGKVVRAEKALAARGLSLSEASFYTDSVTDLALLEAVREPYVVNPDPRLRREAERRGWPILMW
jgi:HAD superfamily hydrolase (TIGR01490 family)